MVVVLGPNEALPYHIHTYIHDCGESVVKEMGNKGLSSSLGAVSSVNLVYYVLHNQSKQQHNIFIS
jgi:hypothetical protein